MKNLENYGVQELNSNEINIIDGGFLEFLAGAIIGGVVYDVVKWYVTEDNEEYGRQMMLSGSAGGAK